jgi:hypothetical protein
MNEDQKNKQKIGSKYVQRKGKKGNSLTRETNRNQRMGQMKQ